jgi:hypothetical protein
MTLKHYSNKWKMPVRRFEWNQEFLKEYALLGHLTLGDGTNK